MRVLYEVLWCKDPDSVAVSTEKIFELGVTDLRQGDGWKKLASMPVCTTCHARLDYGMQFFRPLTSDSSRITVDYWPGLYHGQSGALFGNDIHDQRGDGALTPAGFAALAVAQPEFWQCQVKKISEHVFNESASDEDLAAVSATFSRTQSFRAAMRVALLRYAARLPPSLAASSARPLSTTAGSTTATPDPIRLSDSLHRTLEEECS
jgi:hypothetical protein